MSEDQKNSAFPLPYFTNPDRSDLIAAFPQVEPIYQAFMEKQHIPGVAYGIVIDGELALAGGIGVENTMRQTPVTPDSIFRIASMSKSFTAMAILKLRDDGKLRLDEVAAVYVPELSSLTYPTRDSAPITVRQLMTMTAGFPQDDPWADRQLDASEETFSTWMRGGISFSNPPGVKFEYSNYSYGILGRIVTNVSGMPYQQYIKQNIHEPLGMTSTTYDINQVPPERYAMGYEYIDEQWVEIPPLGDGVFGSMGGLFTTINDFSRYMAFLLSAFPPRNDAETGPVRRSSAREMMMPYSQRMVTSTRPSPDLPAFVMSDGYGFGLVIGVDSVLGLSVSHGGGLPGYGTFYRLLPEHGVGIVTFANLTYMPSSVPIFDVYTLLKKTGGLKPRVYPAAAPLQSYQEAIARLYDRWSDDEIKAISTESLFQDLPLEKRRAELEKLRADFGKRLSLTPIQPENALRGRWLMKCRGGHIEVDVTLAPTVPPLVQHLEFTPAKPLSQSLKNTISSVTHLIRQWDEAQAQSLFARSVKRKTLQAQFAALHVQYGELKLGDVLEGDGETSADVRLLGTHGSVDMHIAIDADSKRIKKVSFNKPRETAFVP